VQFVTEMGLKIKRGYLNYVCVFAEFSKQMSTFQLKRNQAILRFLKRKVTLRLTLFAVRNSNEIEDISLRSLSTFRNSNEIESISLRSLFIVRNSNELDNISVTTLSIVQNSNEIGNISLRRLPIVWNSNELVLKDIMHTSFAMRKNIRRSLDL
jgi:hypothetical protein